VGEPELLPLLFEHAGREGRVQHRLIADQLRDLVDLRVHGRGEPVFRDDPRFKGLLDRFPDIDPARHGLRAIIVVRAEHIRDTCGYAVPFMSYEEDRDLHGKRFAREDDVSLDDYFRRKEHVETSLDGLPGLPLPLPPSTF